MTRGGASRLLLTGPLHDRGPWREAAEALGWSVLERPLLEVRPRSFAWPTGALEGIVLTSGSALESLLEHGARATALDVAVVGAASAARARAAGLRVVHAAERDAAQLAEELGAHFAPGARLLWPHGSRSAAARAGFEAAGFAIEPRLAYETVTLADVAPLPDCEACLLSSPSGVEAALARGLGRSAARLLCIGRTTADALLERLGRPGEVLAAPTPAALADRLRCG